MNAFKNAFQIRIIRWNRKTRQEREEETEKQASINVCTSIPSAMPCPYITQIAKSQHRGIAPRHK